MEYDSVTHRATARRLDRLPSGREISVTVHRYVGGDGPTVYVQAAQHGTELNGPAALRRLHDRLSGTDLAGTVIAVPVANPLAFDNRSYITPAAYDARALNMNRRWPGDETGSLVERLVARLWPLAAEADAAVDLHTGTPEMLSHVRHGADDGAARSLAEAFGTPYRLADASDTTDPPSNAKFRVAAASAGVPAITAELSNSGRVAPSAATTGADGVERVLQSLDMQSGSAPPSTDQSVLHDTPASVVSPASGLFEPEPSLAVGDRITADATIGRVYDPASFETLATPTTTESGVLYSLTHGTVIAGERLAALGAPADATETV